MSYQRVVENFGGQGPPVSIAAISTRGALQTQKRPTALIVAVEQ